MTTQFWQNKEWKGMKAASPRKPRRLEAEPFRPCVPFTWVADVKTGEPWVIPSENQNGSSCATHALLNSREARMRRFIGRKIFKEFEQLDGDAAHAEARRMFYGGDMDGGLYMPEAFAAALAMGIFAPGSMLMTIQRREAMYSPIFEKTPFIDGRDVAGWMNHGTNQENGQIYEGPRTDAAAGHATWDVSRTFQGNQNFWQDQNSWGPKFGYHGLFIMSEQYDEFTGLEDVKYYVVEPEGWETWDGWKKWVIS